MIVAKYARVVVRIAERERIPPASAAKLYQRALRAGVRDYSKGLDNRVARAERAASGVAEFHRLMRTTGRSS